MRIRSLNEMNNFIDSFLWKVSQRKLRLRKYTTLDQSTGNVTAATCNKHYVEERSKEYRGGTTIPHKSPETDVLVDLKAARPASIHSCSGPGIWIDLTRKTKYTVPVSFQR